jgi:phosphate transport system substrate-binding protein
MGELFPGLISALEIARQRPGVPIAATDQDNADLGEQTPGSFIASTLVQLVGEKRRMRVIALDGVEPTMQNFESGAYPYAKTLHFVLGAQTHPSAEQFISFLRSPAGQHALRQASSGL